MGGKSFTLPCTITTNGFGTQIHALCDLGANGFAFMNTSFGYDLAKFHNLKARRLPKVINIRGYNSEVGSIAIYYLRVNFTLNGRKFFNMPFILLDLGYYDLILGYIFFSYFNIVIDIVGR